MRGDEFLDKMALVDPAYIEAAEAPGVKRYAFAKMFGMIAACFVLIISIGFGTYAYATDAKEYSAAVQFFDEYDLPTDGLSRGEIKSVYKDINAKNFSYSKTAEVIANSLTPDMMAEYEELGANPTPEELENLWNYKRSVMTTPEQDQEPNKSTDQRCHHKYEERVLSEGSCTELKSVGKVCIYCGDVVAFTTLGNVHSFGEYTVILEATCESSGSKRKECLLCGKERTEYIPAGHKYEEYTVMREATCFKRGEIAFVCTVCGKRDTESIPTLQHEWQIDDTPATCTKGGQKVKKCLTCGASVVMEYYFPLDHDYVFYQNGDWGCSRCGYGHYKKQHKVKRTTIYPTCSSKGSVYAKCEICGLEDEMELDPSPRAHMYYLEVVTEPTCISVGTKTGSCYYCGEIFVRDIPRTDHHFEFLPELGRILKCTGCGLELPKSGYDVLINNIDNIVIDGQKDEIYRSGSKIVSHNDVHIVDENVSLELADGDFEAYVALGKKGMYIYAEIKDGTSTDALERGECGDYIKLYLDWCTPDIVHPSEEEMEELALLGTPWDPIKYRDSVGVQGLQYIGYVIGYSNGEVKGCMGFSPYDSLGPDGTEAIAYRSVPTEDGWACEFFIPWRDEIQRKMIAQRKEFHIGFGVEVGDDVSPYDNNSSVAVKKYDQRTDVGSQYFENYALLVDLRYGDLWWIYKD